MHPVAAAAQLVAVSIARNDDKRRGAPQLSTDQPVAADVAALRAHLARRDVDGERRRADGLVGARAAAHGELEQQRQ